jgi:type IV pilus assembly protein PilO
MNRSTKLNVHLFLLAVVVAADVFIGVRYALAWRAIRSGESGTFIQEGLRYQQLQSQMQHLNGLPHKVDVADGDAQKFYDERISPNWSTVLAQLGEVASKNQVKLSRAAYAQKPAISGLTELQIDAGLSGQYSSLMHFINEIERDQAHVFFIIDGITLTGQQGGLVNLRLRLTTYIRAGATDLPPAIGAEGNPETATGAGGNAQPAATSEEPQ